MSFERTEQSIKNLSGTTITAEAMLDMMVRAARDVYENNGIKGPNALQVSDGRQLVIKMNNLMNLLNRIYANNTAALSQVTAETRDDLKDAASKLQEAEQIVSELEADVVKAEAQKTKLTEENNKVNKKRGHLRTVKADCDALQKEIDALNDPYLDELADQKAKLEADRDTRKTKSDTLKQEISDLQDAIKTLKDTEKADGKTLDDLTEEKKQLDLQLEGIAKQIEDARTAIDEHDKREAELQGTLDQLQAQLAESQARFSVIQSAWNSAARDAFLQGKLFSGKGELAQEEHPDLAVTAQSVEDFAQLENWFEKTGERIEGLLQVYGAMLKGTVERAKELTAEQEGDN